MVAETQQRQQAIHVQVGDEDRQAEALQPIQVDDDELERQRKAEALQQTVQVDFEERRPNSIATERRDKRSDEVKRRYETTKRCRKCNSVTASWSIRIRWSRIV